MPAWTYAERIGAIPVISLKKEWIWCIFNITPLTMAPVILALSHPHAAHRGPSPFYKLTMSARRGKTLPNWTKKGDLGKERKTWGFLRQWTNSSANTAGIGKLYSPLFWERLSIYTHRNICIFLCVCIYIYIKCLHMHTHKTQKTSNQSFGRSSLGLHPFIEKNISQWNHLMPC